VDIPRSRCHHRHISQLQTTAGGAGRSGGQTTNVCGSIDVLVGSCLDVTSSVIDCPLHSASNSCPCTEQVRSTLGLVQATACLGRCSTSPATFVPNLVRGRLSQVRRLPCECPAVIRRDSVLRRLSLTLNVAAVSLCHSVTGYVCIIAIDLRR
jgi:hypothetical protein